MPGAGNSPDGRTGSSDRAAADRGANADGNRRGNILVRDTGFHDDDWSGAYVPWSGAGRLPALPARAALDVENTARAEEIAPAFERIGLIRIGFPRIWTAAGIRSPATCASSDTGAGFVLTAAFSPINTPWPGGAVSTRWRSSLRSPDGNRKRSGCSVQIGARTTIRSACASIPGTDDTASG